MTTANVVHMAKLEPWIKASVVIELKDLAGGKTNHSFIISNVIVTW